MVDLQIRHIEAVTNAKEAGEMLRTLLEHTHKDQEEARKVRNVHDELLRASGGFES
jgi:hypothetical protein